jgi:hypothetical protein
LLDTILDAVCAQTKAAHVRRRRLFFEMMNGFAQKVEYFSATTAEKNSMFLCKALMNEGEIRKKCSSHS